MNALKNLMSREPVLLVGVLEAVLIFGAAFGLELSAEQVGATMGLANVVLAVVARAFVTPTSSVALTHADVEALSV